MNFEAFCISWSDRIWSTLEIEAHPSLPQDGLGHVACKKADAKRHIKIDHFQTMAYYKMAVLLFTKIAS